MTHIVLYDGIQRQSLLPLTYLRPISEIRIGIRTIEEKWQGEFKGSCNTITQDYLQPLYVTENIKSEKVFINGACLPSEKLIALIKGLKINQGLKANGNVVAFKSTEILSNLNLIKTFESSLNFKEIDADLIVYPEDILHFLEQEFLRDFRQLNSLRASASLDSSVRVRGEDIFIGSDVKLNDVILNATEGPIYIDDGAEIMEGAVIRGPVCIGKYSKVHVGAKIYAGTMLGPHCRVGGELKRTAMFGYANKAHDGYLGDSIIGQWCNLGADTNNSNMKNTYGIVSLFDIENNAYRQTGRQFMGMVLADHTMCGINTSFNTGTVSGIFCSILDKNPMRYIPSFSWGSNEKYQIDKAIEIAKKAMARREVQMSKSYEQAIRRLASLS